MKLKIVGILSIFLFIFMTETAFAVPSLIPLVPLLGVIIFKVSMAIGAGFFLVLGALKEKKKFYLFAVGIVIVGLVAIYYYV